MSEDRLALTTIAQIAITVSDLDRSIAYYRDTLGMPLMFQTPEMAFLRCGSIRVMLSVPEGDLKPRAGTVLYFKVDNISVAHVTFWGRGVKFLDEPHPIVRTPEQEIWMSFFRDPDGNPLALMEERRLI